VVDERTHARTVVALAGNANGGAEAILGRERWHRARDGGGSLRAAVFGVNDGLVSNLSLVMGVAGANPGNRFVLLSGIAGLLAGSFSMAAGEFVSMTAQRELFERQIALEAEELEMNPEEEREELSLIYQAKGVPRAEAEALAVRLTSDKQVALDTLAREELGLDPADLGSPWKAALSSFVMFAAGAIVPVVPYLFGGGTAAVVVSGILSALALMLVGGALALFTGRSPLVSALRMLAIGAVASAITYLVGSVIGVSVEG
jgi:vacuolar iron transporter family protein